MRYFFNNRFWLKGLYLLPLALFINYQSLAQTPFTCDGDFFIALTASNQPSSFYRVIYNGTTVTFNNFTGNVSDGLNSIGYRSTDNFIYGVNPQNLRLYRIDANGNAFYLKQLTGQSSGTSFYTGDITPDGATMVLVGGSQGAGNNELLRIDLTNTNYPVTKVPMTLVGGGPNSTRVADIAFDPTTGVLYAFDFGAGRLITIDQRTGIVNNTKFSAGPSAILFGALFFDEFGELFGYGRNGASGNQREFYSINKRTGATTLLATGPGASGNDGCSCPYRIAMQMEIEPQTARACDTLLYTLRITNSSGTNRLGTDIELPLPAGFIAVGVRRNPLNVAPIGIGTGLVSFQNATIPLGIDSIVIEVLVPGHTAFATFNSQASISNLPSSLGGTVDSDDPGTVLPKDPTSITLLSDTIDLGSKTLAFCAGDSVLVDRRRSDAISYLWDDGSQVGARYFSQSGTYHVVIDDDCLYSTEEITIIKNPLPVIDAGTAPNICEGKSTTLAASGGQSYQWGASPYLSNTNTAFPVATPPLTTKFVVRGIDANGCSDTDTVEVVVRPSPIADAGLDRTVCAGDTISIGSPTIPSQVYSWQPPSGIVDQFASQTEFVVPYTTSAELVVRVTGTFRCETLDTLNLTINALEGQTNGTDILCFGEETGLLVSNWQGLSPVAFQWREAGGLTRQGISTTMSDSIRSLPSGTWYGYATDANGCRWWDTVVLDQPVSALDIQAQNLQNVDCFGNQNGSLAVSTTGGTLPYMFAFDGGPFGTATMYPNLGARPYQTIVVDDHGCRDTLDVSIESPTGLSGNLDALAHPRCTGDSSGWVQFSGQGGQTPYQWSDDGINYSLMNRFGGYPAGTQSFTLRDDNGCIVAVPVTFFDPPVLMLDTTGTVLPVCFGEANGQVSLSATGGSGAYLYGADGLAYSADSVLRDLSAGTYLLQVIDDSLCRDTFPLTLIEPPLLDLDLVVEHVRCFGESNGKATLDVRGGTPPFDAIWQTEPSQQGAIAEELPAGAWQVVVTDRNGCADSVIAIVLEPELLELVLIDTVGAFCELPNGAGEAAARGGTAPYSLDWFGVDTLNGFSQQALWGGDYILRLKDLNGCEDSMRITISNPPAPIAFFQTDPPYQDSMVWDDRDAVLFLNESQFADFYTWEFGDGSGNTLVDPEHHYAEPGSYPVRLVAYDERNACPDSFLLNLKLVPPGAVYFPNAFTPNNDGINDYLTLPGEGLSNIDIRVFNRWGREVRHLTSLSPGWDGLDTKGNSVPEGVYVLQIRALANDGRTIRHTITVTLLR